MTDATAWQLWWAFNQDRFLWYSEADSQMGLPTGSPDWNIGLGKVEGRAWGGLSAAQIDDVVVPAIHTSLKDLHSVQYMKNAMMTMAKVGGVKNEESFGFHLRNFLGGDRTELNGTAAVALGLAYGPNNVRLLESIATDSEAGRKFLKRGAVPTRTRAFAAYGLGLAASQSQDRSQRQGAVKALVSILESSSMGIDELESATGEVNSEVKREGLVDLQVASIVALGLVPLPFQEGAHACYCGECVVENPETSLQGQVTYLLRYFSSREEFETNVRAHTASTLGRLVHSSRLYSGDSFREVHDQIKKSVTRILAAALNVRAKQPYPVINSVVLALGLMGDADDDPVDVWIRSELRRQKSRGGPLAARFALISLAEVGSRGGQGHAAWTATPLIRLELTQTLTRGKSGLRPWAGLALGVFGYQLELRGQSLDPLVDKALAREIRTSRKSKDLGAYALALGLRRANGESGVLVSMLDKISEVEPRSYIALGLGMTGEKSAITKLQEVLLESDRAPLLQNRVGFALGMLGDHTIVESLKERLQSTNSDAKRIAYARALGKLRDKRALVLLTEMLQTEVGEDSPVRNAAMVALGYLSDRTAKPWRSVVTHGTNYLAQSPSLLNDQGGGVLNL